MEQSIPLIKRDRERGITEKKLADELKESRQLAKMERRRQRSSDFGYGHRRGESFQL